MGAFIPVRMDRLNMRVGVIGLGYVGLPTAIGFHEAGYSVWGVDISTRTVEMVNQGLNPTGDPDLDRLIPPPGTERWEITTSTADAVPNCEIVLVTVPTPVDEELKPDLSYVASAGRAVFEAIPKGAGTIVVLESTVYPGVTRETWFPIAEEVGLEIGVDVHIAYCPERFNPGDPARGVRQVARVIGTPDPDIGERLVEFYSKLTTEDVRYVGTIEVAEASKVVENVQRDVNIALVNELARIFPQLGVDVEDVLDAAATKWNFHRYTPGVGVGGHCIPVDPYYLMQKAAKAGVPTDLISAGRAVNRSMPDHVAKVLHELLYESGVTYRTGRILFLGWSYKANVGDLRETPAAPLADALIELGYAVAAWDPFLTGGGYPDGVEAIHDLDEANGFDAVVLITAHEEVRGLDYAELLQRMRRPILFDGRRVLDLKALQAQGWQAHAVGRPIR